jgi:N-acyl-D-amino-acid deacylase
MTVRKRYSKMPCLPSAPESLAGCLFSFKNRGKSMRWCLPGSACVAPVLAMLVAAAALGQASPEVQVDALIAEMMKLTGATAASVAVGRDGEMLYERGYGFSDRMQRRQTSSATTMRLASCTKPVTRALVERLILEGHFDRGTRIYEYLGIEAGREGLADPRVEEITIDHLIQHRGGWDRLTSFDPLYRIDEIARDLRIPRVEKRDIVRYMWRHPLQADPGSEEYYSNFGYLLLGLAIEKATGKSWIEATREWIAEPLGIDDFSLSSSTRKARSSREVWYPRENRLNMHLRDAAGGLVSSAPSMCRFLDAYWIDGLPRTEYRNQYFYQFGTDPLTTTTVMEQRLDGINYVLMFNSRQEETYDADNHTIRNRFNELLDSVDWNADNAEKRK